LSRLTIKENMKIMCTVKKVGQLWNLGGGEREQRERINL
jgi:hypothetical protein